MKITDEIISRIEKALDMRKKDGTPIWTDDDELQIDVAGTFANDKFIVIKKKTPRVESNPDLTLKAHHSK